MNEYIKIQEWICSCPFFVFGQISGTGGSNEKLYQTATGNMQYTVNFKIHGLSLLATYSVLVGLYRLYNLGTVTSIFVTQF